MSIVEDMFLKYRLVMTSVACPEQYDVFVIGTDPDTDEKVGYLRLRHGRFTAEYPTVGGMLVYDTTDISGDGCFASGEERSMELTCALIMLDAYRKKFKLEQELI